MECAKTLRPGGNTGPYKGAVGGWITERKCKMRWEVQISQVFLFLSNGILWEGLVEGRVGYNEIPLGRVIWMEVIYVLEVLLVEIVLELLHLCPSLCLCYFCVYVHFHVLASVSSLRSSRAPSPFLDNRSP